MCDTTLDDSGRLIHTELENRTIAIGYEQLRAIPEVIAVAASSAKARAIRAIARAGIITSLVTDTTAARAILRSLAAHR